MAHSMVRDVSPLVGLGASDKPCAFAVRSDGERIALYWGREGELWPLRSALESAWPEIVVHSEGISPVPNLVQLRAGLAYSGVPAGVSSGSRVRKDLCCGPIDSFLRGMRSVRGAWAWLLVFLPVHRTEVLQWHRQFAELITGVRLQFLQPSAKVSFDRAAKSYEELLEDYLRLLELAFAEGGWLTYGLALTEPASLQALNTALTAAFSGRQSRPEPWRLRTPGLPATTAQMNWAGQLTFLPSSLLALMADLPRQEHPGLEVGEVTRFDLVPPQAPDRDQAPPRAVQLGVVLDGQRSTRQMVGLDLESLTTHMFVSGITGSGKSTTIKGVIYQATQQGVKLLVIEPVKREYRLLRDARGVPFRTYAVGDAQCVLKLNPFAFEGVSVSTHLDLLKALFNAAYVLYAPMPYVLEQALLEVYQDRGWDLVSGLCWRSPKGHARAWPTLTDLYAKVDGVVGHYGYDLRTQSDIRAALELRINNLRLGAKGELLDVRDSARLEDLVSQPTVLELQGIGDAEQRAFVLGLLLTKIYEGCILRGHSEELRLVVVIEEAHRLLGEKAGGTSPDFANPQARAVETLADMLAEMRAYGVGLVIAEQSPSRITRQVLKNTATKVCHQLVDAQDRELVAGSMALTPEESRALTSLSPGEALFFGPEMDRPLRVKINPLDSGLQPNSGSAPVAAGSEDQALRNGLERILAADGGVRMAVHRAVHAWLLEPALASNAGEELTQAVQAASPIAIDDPVLLRDVVSLAGGQILDEVASAAGRLFGYPFPTEEELAKRLKDLLRHAIDHPSSQAGLSALTDWWKPKLKTRRPLAGCQACQAPCLYRLFVRLAGWDHLESSLDRILRAQDQVDWPTVADVICEAATRLGGSGAQSHLSLAVCIAAHQAYALSLSPAAQKAFVDHVLGRLNDVVA